MSAALVTLQIDQGADFTSDTYLWQTSAGTPVDLSGSTVFVSVRTRPDNTSTQVLSASVGGGTVITGGPAGTIVFRFSAANTELVPAGEYCITVMVNVGGVAYMFLSGVVEVRGSTL